MTRVTIIPSDNMVIVGNDARIFDFSVDTNYHAIQWDGEKGFIETISGPNITLENLDEFHTILAAHTAIIAKEVADKTAYDSDPQRLVEALSAIRDRHAETFTYRGVVMRLEDGARADLTALYFQAKTDEAIPDTQIMAVWQEKGFDPLPITAGDLRADGHLFSQHRQKCFAVAAALNPSDYETIEELESAYETLLAN